MTPTRNTFAISLAAAALSATLAAQRSSLPPQLGWQTVRTDLEVVLDGDARTMTVAGTLRLRLEGAETSPGPTIGVNARTRALHFVAVSVDAAGAEVELNLPHPAKSHITLAHVHLAEPARRGDEVTIEFECERLRDSRQLVVEPGAALASWTEAWYPIPFPDPEQSMGAAMRAPGRTTFQLPVGWSAVSNGRHVSREELDGGVLDVWETDEALSRSFAAGPYQVTREEIDGLEVSLYLLSEKIVDARAHVVALGSAMKAMAARFGPYPYPSYAIAEVPAAVGQFGASSEQGFIMVKPSFLAVKGGNLPLFAHESAHGWWGNTVGTDGPGGILCSESLAQYGAVVAIESLEGEEAATEFLRFSRAGYVMDQCARGYFALLRAGDDKPLSQLTSGGGTDHTLSDAKGHWVYHMLRRRVGDERYFATMRGLIERYAGKTLTLAALRETFVDAAPDAELETFFAQWLDRVGAPVLQPTFEVTEGGAAVTIRQVQQGEPYHLKLELLLRLEAGGETLREVDLRQREQRFNLSVSGRVAGVEIDPHHRLLLWHPDYGSPPPGADVQPPGMTAEQIALYAGEYFVAAAKVSVVVFERDGRLMARVASGEPEWLWPVGEHRFRGDGGQLTFDVMDDVATAIDYERPGGGRSRAVRQ